MSHTPPDPSTRSIITAPKRHCEKCGASWPAQKLFHCNRCRTTICLLCQCWSGSRFHSHVQDCMALPHSHLSVEKGSEPILSPRRGLSAPQVRPFTKLLARTWLHGRPAEDVFCLLIDSYRLHSYDKFQFEGENKLGSIFAGATDSSLDFDAYLTVAAAAAEKEDEEEQTSRWPCLLPTWWSRARHEECVQLGLRQDDEQFHDLHVQLSQAMTMDYYQDASFSAQLRMFAEQVLGRPALMRRCTPLPAHLAAMEEEEGNTADFDWKQFNKAFAVQNWPGRSATACWPWGALGRRGR
ncbi:hypothetical protein E4U42_006029 [Claviceps africana]|uniref:Uncharacterized protein n=1 Tax=Claviceps africana TaxID=83212 RepID=A0A8K0NGZ0_9HYPO|nr:hypothetical protein E4U42_006029 [Claviceps africana]